MSTIQLTADQQNASVAFTDFLLNPDEKYMVINGSAGTGKSTLVKHLIDTMKPRMKLYSVLLGEDKSLGDFSIELTATTNKAAVVLAELSGTDPRTIHSKLGLTPKPNFETGELDFIKGKNYQIISNTLLVIDEASFISNQLYKDIDSSTVKCKIILVGDEYQLAPVRQSDSIMASLNCMKVSLNDIVRHGGPIADLGAQFREAVKTGKFTDISPDGMDIIHVDGSTFQRMIDETFTDPEYHADKARVLV
jgi:exodeoxyribonuclease V